jgi:hypothetical protein
VHDLELQADARREALQAEVHVDPIQAEQKRLSTLHESEFEHGDGQSDGE